MEFGQQQTTVSISELAMVAGTRALIGAGLGLLLANRLNSEQRKAVGWSLLSVGAVSTIPLGLGILNKIRLEHKNNEMYQVKSRQDMI